MRILFVANSESIHTARWISALAKQPWKLDLFPSHDSGVAHVDLSKVNVYHSVYGRKKNRNRNVSYSGLPVVSENIAFLVRGFLKTYFLAYRRKQLEKIIRKTRPDIIHAIEFQKAGYLVSSMMGRINREMPPCIITNLGSDIYLFGRLKEHDSKIRNALQNFDYYTCECERDVTLARKYGFSGTVLPVIPNTGGFELDQIDKLRSPGPVSARKRIMLKGYQHWAGRALVGLRALERCAGLIKDYEIVIYSASPEVVIAAELFERSIQVKTTILPSHTAHNDILRHHGSARISIGLSISDALSTSSIEALAMGSFPIQSNTACIDEWIEDGRTGIIVPPNDPDIVELAIKKALTDDHLVDKAAQINIKTVKERLDSKKLGTQIVSIYTSIAREKGIVY